MLLTAEPFPGPNVSAPTQTHFPFLLSSLATSSSCISSFIHYKNINSTEVLWKLGNLIFNYNLYHCSRSFNQYVLLAHTSGRIWHIEFPWFWNRIQAEPLHLPPGDKAHTQVLQTVHFTKHLNLTGKREYFTLLPDSNTTFLKISQFTNGGPTHQMFSSKTRPQPPVSIFLATLPSWPALQSYLFLSPLISPGHLLPPSYFPSNQFFHLPTPVASGWLQKETLVGFKKSP